MDEATKHVMDRIKYGDEFLWIKKHGSLLVQLIEIRGCIRNLKRTFISEIGTEYIEEAEKNIQLSMNELENTTLSQKL